jgi:transcriptional repressor NrdR
MKCPYCRQPVSEVFNSRTTKFGTQIWRRRRCSSCGQSFTTYEASDLSFLQVINKSGQAEGYSRAKLFTSIYAAFADLPDKPPVIDAITDTIEAKLLDLRQPQPTSEDIATIVLQTLKRYHTTAFVRYLSSQAQLTSQSQLRNELKKY